MSEMSSVAHMPSIGMVGTRVEALIQVDSAGRLCVMESDTAARRQVVQSAAWRVGESSGRATATNRRSQSRSQFCADSAR